MEVGISTASFYPDALTEEAIPLIKKLGEKKIEVFLGSFSEYTQDFCRELREKIDRYGLSVHSLHALGTQFEPQLFSLTKRQRDDSLDILKRIFQCAEILGAQVYVFHGPPVRANTRPALDYPRIGLLSSDLADLAGEYGIKFSWENVSWCWYSFPQFSDRLMEHIKSENLYFTLDIKQAMQAGFSPMEFAGYMGNRVINVHAIDFNEERELTLPGRGIFDFEGLYNELKSVHYQGLILLEVYRNNYDHYSDMKGSLEFLRNIFENS